MTTTIEESGFLPLPVPVKTDGSERLCGVEIEFAGLSEADAAAILQDHFGGSVEPDGHHQLRVEGSRIGDIGVELDASFAKEGKSRIAELAVAAGRDVIPVEIVSPPLTLDQMRDFDSVFPALRAAGAEGTDHGLLQGFGVHFNPEVTAPDSDHTLRVILAFALLEPWLRSTHPVDVSRRILPFISPWPDSLVTALCDMETPTLDAVAEAYCAFAGGRNYGLDLLPLFRSADPEAFEARFGDTGTNARPCFHFRLPDCRLSDPSWTLASEWTRWWLVETLAERTDLLDALKAEWLKRDAELLPSMKGWPGVVSEHIGEHAEELVN